MNETSEARIRRYLDEHGGAAQVPFHNLMTTWNVHSPTQADSQRIQDALRSAGVVTQPELAGLAPESLVWLQVSEVQAPPPPAPAPQPPPPRAWAAPPEPQAPPASQWGAEQAPQPGTYATPPAAPPTYAPQQAAQPQFEQQAPAAPAYGRPEEAPTIGLALGAGAAVAAVISSFLTWVSAFDEGSSLWELAEVLDVFLVVLALGVIGASVAVMNSPGLHALRVLLLALLAGLLALVLIPPIEFIVSGEGDVSGSQVGEFVALLAAVGLIGALALQVSGLGQKLGSVPRGRDALLLLAGLAVLCLVGVAQPLVQLLPVDTGVSYWEANEAADILNALVALALAGVAAAAVAGLAPPGVIAVAFVLGSFVGIGTLIFGIEGLAGETDGAGVLVSLFLLAPLAIAGSALVALGSNLLRQGTQT